MILTGMQPSTVLLLPMSRASVSCSSNGAYMQESNPSDIPEKHAGGRPLKFKTPEDIKPLIDAYFDQCVKEEKPLTITGLAMALDTSRETLMNYEKRDEFFDTIKRAKLRVENDYEIALRTKGGAGEIFGLKNFGWKDKSEVGVTGPDGKDLNWTIGFVDAK